MIFAEVSVIDQALDNFVNLFVGNTSAWAIAIIIIFFTIIVQKVVKQFITQSFHKSSRVLKVDETNYKFFKHLISAIIYILGFSLAIYAIPSLRSLSVSLFAGAGIVAVIVGFASQQAFSNFVSGIIITIFKPFRVGDRIKIGTDIRGIVEDLNLHHTVIRNFENKRIVIPNAVISSQTIENSTLLDEKVCRFIEFSVGYDTNLDQACRSMQEEAEKHPLCRDNRSSEDRRKKEPIVKVRVVGFTDSGVTLRAAVWVKDPNSAFILNCDLNKSIKERFDKEGIEIPYPYRMVVFKDGKNKMKPKKRNKSFPN